MGLYVSKGVKEKHFDDEYTLCQRLGKGAYAEVFLCVHKGDKARRAAKIVDIQKLDDKDKAHLEDEIFILKRLDHPGIIRLYDVYRSPTSVYIVQELCSGGELFDRIVLRHHYTEHCARELVRHVLQAASYAHSQGVVHRDLKPENILLAEKDNDTVVKLADFGLAHALGSLDGLHTICGTPSYMSPEVVSRKPYTEKTDCWSIGVITYVLLGGFCPFEDPSLPVMLSRIKKASYKFYMPYFRAVSEDAKDFIKHLLVVDPAKRLTARAALEHKWFRLSKKTLSVHCLSDTQEKLKELRNSRTRFKAAVDTVISLNRMRVLSGGSKLSDSVSSMASSNADVQSPHGSSVSSMDLSNHGPDGSRHGAPSPGLDTSRHSSVGRISSPMPPHSSPDSSRHEPSSSSSSSPSRTSSTSSGERRPDSPNFASADAPPNSTAEVVVIPVATRREPSAGYGYWEDEEEEEQVEQQKTRIVEIPAVCDVNAEGLLKGPGVLSSGGLTEGEEESSSEEEGEEGKGPAQDQGQKVKSKNVTLVLKPETMVGDESHESA